MFSHLLLAIDGSDHSRRAAEKAIELGKLTDHATIEILYVVDGSKSKSDILKYGDSEAASKNRQQMLHSFEELINDAGISTKITILHAGTPAESIIKHANEGNYDCVVLGSRGLSTVQTMIIGSVSHKVMKYAKAPVLMVK
ncbi:universal stress protein [Evansella cellulosilytica]|uniref:UspA domain-containing protein n=1 Tax=Evansella cellulosilytica (strain ATCC 21833 / DSM 2522 / FERM P-1141 / JCM 9156 / N-4) TaxID=649639 RepID=E6TUZ5_EVAC2|nr:universal stress protein [Evansella cellulosilytica]ADU28578.1 UspA domain-containing protein [Evansella cellulosilytica DSM 2522]